MVRWSKEDIIPKPFPLGPNKIAWDENEINEAIENKKKIRGFFGHKPEKINDVNKTQ